MDMAARWRSTALGLIVLALIVGISWSGALAGPPITATGIGEVPTTGGMRSGPLGLNPPTAPQRGVLPLAIQIERAGVDAEVETVQIIDGVMQDPTGPWVVGWYRETAQVGEPGNAVMAGHVDYWDVGPAVFYNLENLQPGDEIRVTGEDGRGFTYQVEWLENVDVLGLTTERIQELVGPTEEESLTLITCGGEFDYATGEYLSRLIVRAVRVG